VLLVVPCVSNSICIRYREFDCACRVQVCVSSPECRTIANSKQIIQKCGRVQIFGNGITYQNWIQEEIKSTLNFGNDCYHSVQIFFLFSRLLSKNIKIKTQNHNFTCCFVWV
jgi:hypothetical protein